MEHADSPMRSSSIVSKSTALGFASSQIDAGTSNLGSRPVRVLTVTSAVIHNIPGNLRLRKSCFFGNKVVLAFEEEFTIAKAQDWVGSYVQSEK